MQEGKGIYKDLEGKSVWPVRQKYQQKRERERAKLGRALVNTSQYQSDTSRMSHDVSMRVLVRLQCHPSPFHPYLAQLAAAGECCLELNKPLNSSRMSGSHIHSQQSPNIVKAWPAGR